jgi:nitroimidazol reductase NimA-like FMN-containing flavoprotein (pyridoxamine 5'-phosphate oxidase superfamily)
VDIQPVHYVYSDKWLYGRTEPGTKLSTIAHHPWVAFEVDETQGLFEWQSVVVHGNFEVLDEDWHQKETLVRARTLLRRLLPETLTPDDPVPFRNVLFRVYLSQVSGRSCHLEAAASQQ